MTPVELAYVAAVIDSLGVITTRTVGGTELPQVIVQGRMLPLLEILAEMTGTKVTTVVRRYDRMPCTEHCEEAHSHVESTAGRWVVTGARAQVVIRNVLPYLRVQQAAAAEVLAVGQSARYKGSTLADMTRLGWAS